jgi:two-component system sensor histidine kinase KdpD
LDFFFIKPYYHLHINSAEDGLMLLMFFLIALINGVLTYKVRKAEQLAQSREARWNTMKLYNTLLDSLSHELRTPIATIMGAVGTMQEKNNSLTDSNKENLLLGMEKATMRLNHQVENLLNMSRLESGFIEPKFDWCDLNELVYNVVGSLREELASHTVSVRQNEYLPLFRLDYGLTEQVLYNLLYNAAQYSPAYSAITVIIEYKPEVDFELNDEDLMTCSISVEDEGAGFPHAQMERVFEKFYRLPHSRTGGTGLGLSIVKGFTESQGGTVTLKNKQSGGSIFTLYFPAQVMQIKNIGND